MCEFFIKLFETSDFHARWNCGTWAEGHGWLHIISDLAIGGAYVVIPLLILFFTWRRKDLPFMPVFLLFAMFIFSCGFGHLVEASIFWKPWYRFSGFVKLITAVLSWATVIALIPLIPRALSLPRLVQSHKELRTEVGVRRESESRLHAQKEELQRCVNNFVERENRILELKNEVNRLSEELGRRRRYEAREAD
jgi:hypothetical protein